MVLLCLSFYGKTCCSLGTQSLELENRHGEQNAAPITHGKIVIDLLYPLVTHKSKGLGGIHPRVLKKLSEVLTKPLSIIVLVNWGGHSGLQFGQCDAHL